MGLATDSEEEITSQDGWDSTETWASVYDEDVDRTGTVFTEALLFCRRVATDGTGYHLSGSARLKDMQLSVVPWVWSCFLA